MRNLIFLAAMAVAILLATQVNLGQPETAPAMADVEATILGPDSKPLANAAVEFFDTDKHPFPENKPAHANATTDEHGVAHFQWKAGVSRMWAKVHAVGYGICGLTEFIPNAATRATFPPLAPYATVSGTIPRELIGKAVLVRALNGGIEEGPTKASLDETGRFEFTDLMSGSCSLAAKDAEGRFLAETYFNLNPGVHIQGVKLKLNTEKEASASTQPIFMGGRDPDNGKTVTWASGVVRDVKGKALAAVDVYAVATYHGGIRMYEDAKKTATDQNGRYKISGEGGLSMFSSVIVAHKEGFVPAMAWFDRPRPNDLVGQPPASQPAGELDLALTDLGGTLNIRVLEQGKPAAGVSVVIRGAGAALRGEWARETHNMRPEIEAFLYPELTADDRGEVHFQRLMPGYYQATAARRVEFNGEVQGARLFDGPFAREGRKQPHALAEGIAVRTGETQSVLMRISREDCTATFAFHGTDGQRLAGNAPFDWAPATQSAGWSSSTTLDGNGAATHAFESPGLWRVESKHRRSPISTIPVGAPPYDVAGGIVAVSAAMQGTARPVFTARHHAPGTAEIQVMDVNGRPMHAVVEIRQGDFTPAAMGATNENGFVRLEGVMEWPHLRLSARPVGVDDRDVRPLKADDVALRGRVFFPEQPGLIKGDQVTKIVLQQVPAGYVRGKLHPAPGTSANQYRIAAGEDGWQASYDAATGDYLAGPLVAGKTTISIYFNGYNDAGTQEVNIIGGDVLHADLTAAVTEAKAQDANLLIGAGGASSLSHEQDLLRGQVLLSDGKTPAYGAVVSYVQPHEYQALYTGTTDVHGAIHSRGMWRWQEESSQEPPGGPTEPVVVAYLPGACGAIIAPPPKKGQKLSLVLPPPLVLRGKVTVAGAERQTGTLRVYAAYEGKGTLNHLLSVSATARADGAYELAGLTPGTYRVQAALDDIWLSAPQTLELKDQSPAPINLNISAPGTPVRVKVTDETGAALAGISVAIERPAGPLAAALWPKGFETDGAGMAWIPTLESGKHTLLVGDVKKEIDVPALPAAGAVDVTIVAKPSRTGR